VKNDRDLNREQLIILASFASFALLLVGIVLMAVFCGCTPATPAPIPVARDADTGDPPRCGTERWVVKTGQDLAGAIAMPVVVTTVRQMGAIARPTQLPEQNRVPPAESTLYELRDVTIAAIKFESDRDAHLVLQQNDPIDPHIEITSQMIAEIPDPSCCGASPWRSMIAQARDRFMREGGPYPEVATLRGVGFFDKPHGQTGMAPNAIEIHPVLQICFGRGCQP